MATFSLSRSKHLIPFAALVSEAGQRVDRVLRKAGLPSDCLDDPETLIPSQAVFRFREFSARTLGLPNIALDATRDLHFSELGEFGRALLGAPTLHRLLTTFRDHINTETTITEIELERLDSGDLSFCYRFQHVPAIGVWHSDLYTFQWAIKIIRLVSPTWSPETMWSISHPSAKRQQVFARLGTGSVDFEHGCTGFMIPSSMLALPLQDRKQVTRREKAQLPKRALPDTYSDAIERVIATYASDRWLSIEEAAEVLGTSTRSLQRRLGAEHTTYSGVVERTRSEMAGELLEQTDASVADIAASLGYRSQANFTRAFRRWSGVSPSEYRRGRMK